MERYAWTVFVVLGALVLLFGVTDITSANSYDTFQGNALNEIFIGLLGVVVAVGGLRRGERWAWYATALWPVWLVAQGLLAWSWGRSADALSAVVFLALSLAALALSYRNLPPAAR